jgi:hypothetical protein
MRPVVSSLARVRGDSRFDRLRDPVRSSVNARPDRLRSTGRSPRCFSIERHLRFAASHFNPRATPRQAMLVLVTIDHGACLDSIVRFDRWKLIAKIAVFSSI